MIDGARITPAEKPLRVRAEGEALARGVYVDPGRLLELALADDDMTENQQAARRTLDGYAPRGGRLVRGDAHRDGNGPRDGDCPRSRSFGR